MPAMPLDAIVVGAGFAGLYALHKLRAQGLSVRVLEAAPEVGGTWYYNRYPGARCDVESVDYCYSFSDELQQEWNWTEKYATQAEILELPELGRRQTRPAPRHRASTPASSLPCSRRRRCAGRSPPTPGRCSRRGSAVMATGPLSAALTPNFPGLDTFAGEIHHTAHWPHEPVDFAGKRVAVIGTGSSGIQSIPIIAEQAAHLYVFQRTPNYSVPAGNKPLSAAELDEIKAGYARAAPAVVAQRRRLTAHHRREADDGVHPAGAARGVRKAMAAGRRAVLEDIPGPDDRPGSQRRGPQVLRGEGPRGHRRSGGRRPADSQRPPDRHQANLHRQQLLSDLQPAERVAGQRARHPDRIDRRHRDQHHRGALRPRHDRAGNGFRRDDRGAGQDRHRRAWRRDAARRLGARTPHLSGIGRRRVSQSVPDLGPGSARRAGEHGAARRGSGELDRRGHRLPRQPRLRRNRSHRGQRGRLGRRMRPACRGDAVHQGELLVHGRERARESQGASCCSSGGSRPTTTSAPRSPTPATRASIWSRRRDDGIARQGRAWSPAPQEGTGRVAL